MKIMNEIIKDIEDLRNNRAGETHGYFTIGGYPSDDWLGIDTLDICKALAPYEIDYELYDSDQLPDEKDMYGFSADYATRYIDYLIELDFIENWDMADSNNTYNWSASVSNDIDYTVFNSLVDNSVYVLFKVHRFGDVRGNYTDNCILHFDSESYWLEAFSGVSKSVYIDVDEVEYAVEIEFWNEGLNVYRTDTWDYLFTDYGYNIDEATEEIKEKLASDD